MADFQEQTMGITGLTIDASSTVPSRTEFSQFLVDGVKDVTNKIVQIRPDLASLFSTSTTQTSATGTAVDSGIVISVWRENGTADQLESASMIDPGARYRSTDPTSLFYKSKFNPGWYWEGNTVTVVPAPGSSGNSAKVQYVTYDETVVHSSTTIANFPDQYEHLVILYASIQSIQAYLADFDNNLPAGPGALSVVATLPTAPTITAAGVTITGTAPTYVTPILSTTAFPTITWSLPTTPVAPALDNSTIAALATAPVYTAPTSVPDIAGFDTQIADDDPELAGSVNSKVSAELTKYQADIQNELNVFNKNNVDFQSDMQKKFQDAQISSTADQNKIQKYTTEVGDYSARINAIVVFNQGEIAEWQTQNATEIQKFGLDIQNALNDFNKESAEYQAILQKDIQDATLEDSEEGKKIEKYKSEVQAYQADVGGQIQAYQSKLGLYTTDIQKISAKYLWAQGRYTALRQQYGEAFGLMVPPKQEKGE